MPYTLSHSWTNTRKIGFKYCCSWIIILCFSFSYPHALLHDPGYYISPFFEHIVKWVAGHILHLKGGYNSELISDSTGLYIHFSLSFIYAVLTTLIWTTIDKNKRSYSQLRYWLIVFVRYYLAFQLFIYGFGKTFKWQFYLPEPNTLFTNVGDMHKDILYWSVMGSSRAYNIFTGSLEVLAAALLIFRRTYIAAAILALAAMINIVAINFSFDISVKLYSLFLTMLCLFLLAPFIKSLFKFFFFQQPVQLKPVQLNLKNAGRKWYIIAKTFAVLLILADSLYFYIKANNFNDDVMKRPLLHGAYQVNSFVVNKDTVAPLITNPNIWKRVFIHRKGYFIAQYMDDSMQDYELQYDTINKYLVITDYEKHTTYNMKYEAINNELIALRGEWGKDSLQLQVQKMDIEKMPLMQKEFNWTMDE